MRVPAYALPEIPVVRVLVTGGRRFLDLQYVHRVLDAAHARYGFRILIHGGARGVDLFCDQWARARGVQPCRCDALWTFHINRGQLKVAGTVRNGDMLLLDPHLLLAFPGDRGTADMRSKARAHGLPVVDLTEDFALEQAE